MTDYDKALVRAVNRIYRHEHRMQRAVKLNRFWNFLLGRTTNKEKA